MADLTNETRLTASQALRHPTLRRGPRPLNRSVLEHWWTRGIRPAHGGEHVVLESFRVGGLRFTTAEAIARFFAAINGEPVEKTTPAHARREHARAERELNASRI